MKSTGKIIISLALIVLFMLLANETFAQCAMCRANAESSLKNGPSIAKGLNAGILYLMAIPYLLLAFIFREQLKSLFFRMKAKYSEK